MGSWAGYLRGLEPYIRSGTIRRVISGLDALPTGLLDLLNQWGTTNVVPLALAREPDAGNPHSSLFLLAADQLERVHAEVLASGIDKIPFLVLMDNGSTDLVELVAAASKFSSTYVVHIEPLAFSTFGHHGGAEVSLVIPAMTCKGNFDRCVDSLLSQDFPGRLELLFIGADENQTADRIARKAASYERVAVRFVASGAKNVPAWNAGISSASGTFIGFIDPLDQVLPTYVDSLYRTALLNDSDVAEGAFKIEVTGVNADSYLIPTTDGPWFPVVWPAHPLLTIVPRVWGRIYRKKLLILNRIQFRSNLSVFSEILFIIDVFSTDCSVAMDRSINYYRSSVEGIQADEETLSAWPRFVDYIGARNISRSKEGERRSILFCLLSSMFATAAQCAAQSRRGLLAVLASAIVEKYGPREVSDMLKILRTDFPAEREVIKTFERGAPRRSFKRSISRLLK